MLKYSILVGIAGAVDREGHIIRAGDGVFRIALPEATTPHIGDSQSRRCE
ncbi:hypothetical protein RF656_21430 [Yersinia kristensenii]|nr:hypothetical protein [Yersinia kristensenii]MDR4899279.1 hypothetical protein [Yersinia kristensenii]